MNNEELKEIARALVKKYASRELQDGLKPAGLHFYRDASGNLIYMRIRLKHHNGDKWIRPFYFDTEKQDWLIGEPIFSNKKPLYFLPQLTQQPHAVVWIVEGELKAEKLLKLGFLATTSGSSSSANDTDWAILRDHQIIIWRDFDDSGLQYAHEVTKILTALNCSIRYVDVDQLNLPIRGDIVDWLKANPAATADDILSLPTINNIDILSGNSQQSSADFEAILYELAQLEKIDYIKRRKNAASSLGIGVTQLDSLVKDKQDEIKDSDSIFPKIIPWHESVDGQSLFDELEELINSIMVFPSEHEVKAIVLYILHTHFIDAADCSPILLISSPEKRCGKSTLISVLQKLVHQPLIASNISSAALYRSIEKWAPTL